MSHLHTFSIELLLEIQLRQSKEFTHSHLHNTLTFKQIYISFVCHLSIAVPNKGCSYNKAQARAQTSTLVSIKVGRCVHEVVLGGHSIATCDLME